MLIGYARVSTNAQDLTAQRDALAAAGVDREVIYVDQGFTGTQRDRPGLGKALAACRRADTLVVTKLDRLARSLPDARDIADELTRKGVALDLGGSVYNPNDPVGKILFNVLGMIAEFESDLIRARTREGMAVAKAKGRLRGNLQSFRKPKKHTSSVSTKAGPTPPQKLPSYSALPAQRFTGPSKEHCRRRPSDEWQLGEV